jgi:hypothetical protein
MKEEYNQHFFHCKEIQYCFHMPFSGQLFTTIKIVHIDENPGNSPYISLNVLYFLSTIVFNYRYTYVTSVVSGPGMSSSRNLFFLGGGGRMEKGRKYPGFSSICNILDELFSFKPRGIARF